MKKLAVINVVGLTADLLSQNMPFLSQWAKDQKRVSTINPVLPALTCTAQSTYLTGKYPNEHGIVANGWYFKEECEVKLWRQSNHLVQAPKIWEVAKAKNPEFTCANMFWWYNMYSTADYSVTPRPQYRANGQKVPDCYSHPAPLRNELQQKLGTFPLFHFWGPKTSIKSSRWIADAAKYVYQQYAPTLTLVYLPHLDYVLQKYGPEAPQVAQDLKEIDKVCADLYKYLTGKGVEVIFLSEYGIAPASQPVHINRVLRKHNYIQVREENGKELLDAGASTAFAMADHQLAHVYVNDQKAVAEVKDILERTEGIAEVLDGHGKGSHGLNHPRSGELVAVAADNHWFTYYYWLDDTRAPDFARTVDIHRKPGYDPAEMFFDPKKKNPMLRAAFKLLKKKLGFRTVMNLIGVDATVVKGSHGRADVPDAYKPVLLHKPANGSEPPAQPVPATDIYHIIKNTVLPG